MNISSNPKKIFVPWFLLFLPLIGVIGCNKKAEPIHSQTEIHDAGKILSAGTQEKLRELGKATEYPLYVQTRDSVLPQRINLAADKAFETLARKNDTLRQQGVFLFITQHPSLVQLRAGKDLALRSMWNNMARGDTYMSIQNHALEGNLDEAALRMVQHASGKLSPPEIPWYKTTSHNAFTRYAYRQLNYLGQPEASFFGDLLIPLLKLGAFEIYHLNTMWVTFIIAVLFVFLLSYILQSLLRFVIGTFSSTKRHELFLKNTGKYMQILLGLVILLMTAAVMYSLSSTRMEDKIALVARGIEASMDLHPPRELFYSFPSLLLFLLLAFLVSLKRILENIRAHALSTTDSKNQRRMYQFFQLDHPPEANQLQRKALTGIEAEDLKKVTQFNKAPYSCFSDKMLFRKVDYTSLFMVVLLFFLPRVLFSAAAYYLTVSVVLLLFPALKKIRKLRSDVPLRMGKIAGMILLPLVMIVIIYTIMQGFSPYAQFSWFLFAPGIAVATIAKQLFSLANPTALWLVTGIALLLLMILLFRRWEIKRFPLIAVKKYLVFTSILFLIGVGAGALNKGNGAVDQTMATLYPALYKNATVAKKQYIVTTQSLNFRKEAGSQYPVVGGLALGDTVFVLNKKEKDWWKIKFKNKTGYVFSKYLQQCPE